METFIFLVAGMICLTGAIGVVASKHPVHSALSLVGTLFGVAVLFVNQNADFLAAVQVIVYAGAIVVLFLFVIMLLGVDAADELDVDPIVGHRSAAIVVGLAIFALPVAAIAATGGEATGIMSNLGPLSDTGADIERIGELIFTRYLLAFEATSVLLVIAVVGAVMLARRSPRADEIEIPPHPLDTAAEAASDDTEEADAS